jgi:hypothetical protein
MMVLCAAAVDWLLILYYTEVCVRRNHFQVGQTQVFIFCWYMVVPVIIWNKLLVYQQLELEYGILMVNYWDQ